ncbi:MAG: hypothetical protein QM607_10975 [Microbacterium sp.]
MDAVTGTHIITGIIATMAVLMGVGIVGALFSMGRSNHYEN